MQSLLPEYLDLIQKANIGCEIEGVWPVKKLDRLVDLLATDTGTVAATLSIGREGKLRILQGKVTATLEVTCQRCMQTMELPLESDIRLALVTDEAQAERLPADIEPLLVDADKVHLPGIVEDELLLLMPLVAMHDYDCSDYLQQQKHRLAAEEDQMKAEKDKQNPFSVLKDLL